MTKVKVIQSPNIIVQDTITKNDIIDFTISRKVEEIKKQRAIAQSNYESASIASTNDIDALQKKKNKLKSIAIDEFINTNYKSTIDVIESNLKIKPVIYKSDDRGARSGNLVDDLMYMLRLKDEIAILFISDTMDKMRDVYSHHPMAIMSQIQSLIRVDISKVTTTEIESIDSKVKEIKTNLSDLNKIVKDFDYQIIDVRNQKDIIKNALIEKALSGTEEGIKILETINAIDFSTGNKKLK